MDVPLFLPEIAERLSQKGRAVGLSVVDLKTECPWIFQQILRDVATPELFALWSDATNFDELAAVPIVEPSILSVIGELAHTPMTGPGVHAGLQHTYGYLLSTIETPFGYKRDRWSRPCIAEGFGLPSDVLVPYPSVGTLLSNATLFAGRVAFRGDVAATSMLRRVTKTAAPSIARLSSTSFNQSRIVESLSLRDSAGRSYSIQIRTDLVPFPRQITNTPEDHLLVYSVEDSRRQSAQLTTLFPVTSQFVTEATQPERFRRDAEIRLRFNAFVPGVNGQTLVGDRTLVRFTEA